MAKPAPELRVNWSKRERALLYHGDSPTGGMLSSHFERNTAYDDSYCGGKPKTLAQELDARGYDLTTLRFSIRKKVTP